MKTYLMILATAAALAGCTKKEEDAAPLAAATQSADVTVSDQYGVIHSTPYFMQNDFWNYNATGAVKPQSCFFNNINDWGANSAHTYGTGEIKSYPSIVYGRHYGTSSGAGRLPRLVQSLGTVHTSWSQLSSNSAHFDAAYDLWFDPNPYQTGMNRDELMVWVNWAGTNPLADSYNASGAVPYAASVYLGGRHWNIYHKDLGSGRDVMSFLPASGGQNSITLDMKPLINYCVGRGWLQTSESMTSVQAGWEIIQGGTFRTSAFHIDPTTL